ncbi:MAG: hypothetical protein Q8J74_05055 [Candidatus Didemnitutus sp.]|nr:hypothetical protein [Candidatus Didemnitutus sp.]
MQTPAEVQRVRGQLLVWWIIWGSLLAGLGLIYVVIGPARGPAVSAENPLTDLSGLVPLFLSIIIRWLVLPRYTEAPKAFVMFVLGLALAESCGLLGIFFGGPYRDDLFVLGLLGIGQFVPFYARRLYEPRATGFIPNN